MKQQNLFTERVVSEFGGSKLKGRKGRRPLDSKRPIHLILKATNSRLLLRNKTKVQIVILKMAKRFGIRVYSNAVQADHIHLQIQISNRIAYRAWIRSVTGNLARAILGLKWKLRPYSRLVTWGMDFKCVQNYIAKNKRHSDFVSDCQETLKNWDRWLLESFEIRDLDGPFLNFNNLQNKRDQEFSG